MSAAEMAAPHAAAAGVDAEIDPAVHARRWWILGVLCLSMTIIVMDNTILNVAIPKLITDLNATNSQVQWIIDSYTIVFAGLLLTTGSLSDRFGRKGALQVGIVLFGLGSVASALATSAPQLIVTRAFMGIGGALIMPSTLSLLTNTFRDPKERGRAIGIWAGFSGVGVAAGPLVGGLLLRHFSWSSVFWVNIPIGATALIAGAFLLPKSREDRADRLDPVGSVLSIIGLATFLYGVIEVPEKGWTSAAVLAGFGFGIVGIAAFILWEQRIDHPMLDMRFFKNPRFTAANTAVTFTFFAMFGSLFLMTQYWQFIQGYSPLSAGVHLIPYALGMMVVAPLSSRLVERVGSKRVITFGLFVVTSSLIALSFLSRDTPYWLAIIPFCGMSAGIGLTMPPATESVMGSLPRDKAGVGSAVNDTTRQMGGAVGVALIGSVVSSIYASRVDSAGARFHLAGAQLAEARSSLGGGLKVAHALGENAIEFSNAVKTAFVTGLSSGLRMASIFVVFAGFVVWRYLPARAPGEDTMPAASPDELAELADSLVAGE
ncbi:MAG: drug resistance transporter [Ilumatobacteraceae bacterium]|nr:drug resistance transporter [Ilumatobacteraceae bacterium]MCU1391025.1 drug resistance transporter [Ilumatobacteraceae bacterium]